MASGRRDIVGLQSAVNSNEWMPSLDHSAKAKSGGFLKGASGRFPE
jgi:hypothetical protein